MAALFAYLRKIKDILILLIFFGSIMISGYTYVTTKFALKEYVDYMSCTQDRQMKMLDIKSDIYQLNNDLGKLYEEQALFEQQHKNKSVTLNEYVEMKKLNDLVTKAQAKQTVLQDNQKKQEDRDCMKEIRDAKK